MRGDSLGYVRVRLAYKNTHNAHSAEYSLHIYFLRDHDTQSDKGLFVRNTTKEPQKAQQFAPGPDARKVRCALGSRS